MDISDEEEALVERVIERVLKRYQGLMTPEELAIMREVLWCEMLFSPEGELRLRRARSDPKLARSGDVVKSSAASIESQPAQAKRKRGGV